LIAQLPFAARLHLAAGFASIATLPGSRLGAALVWAAWRLLDGAGDALESAARGLVGRLRPQRLLTLVWPEDELLDWHRLAHRRRPAISSVRATEMRHTTPITTGPFDAGVPTSRFSAEEG
jgi:hypothetical protein